MCRCPLPSLFAGMSRRGRPRCFPEGGTGRDGRRRLGSTLAAAGPRASWASEEGGLGCRLASQLLTGRGGGSGQTFFPPSLSEGTRCLGAGERRGKERCRAWAAESQRRVLMLRACFARAFSTRGSGAVRLGLAAFRNPAVEEGGSRSRRARGDGGRKKSWAGFSPGLPRRAGARLPTPAESLPKVSLGFKELREGEEGEGGEGGGG